MVSFLKTCCLILLGISALSTAAQAAEKPADKKDKRPALEKKIDAAIADTNCSNSDQCKIIGFGVKPCGGPASYKLFSTLAMSEDAMMKLVNEYNLLDVAQNEKADMVGTCEAIVQPSTICLKGSCKLVNADANILYNQKYQKPENNMQ